MLEHSIALERRQSHTFSLLLSTQQQIGPATAPQVPSLASSRWARSRTDKRLVIIGGPIHLLVIQSVPGHGFVNDDLSDTQLRTQCRCRSILKRITYVPLSNEARRLSNQDLLPAAHYARVTVWAYKEHW